MISPYKELLNTIVLLTVDKFDPEMAATLSRLGQFRIECADQDNYSWNKIATVTIIASTSMNPLNITSFVILPATERGLRLSTSDIPPS